jgi:hypothetical protein
VTANQIDVLLAEHNRLSMFSADNFHFLHHFHHFLVRLQLAYFEVRFFFAGGTFGHFILRIALDALETETVSTTLESIGDAVE